VDISVIESTIQLRKLTAAEGMTLYNGETLGKEIYLGKNDWAENWREITDAEAAEIIKKMEESENV
jgi:hypothetical protein